MTDFLIDISCLKQLFIAVCIILMKKLTKVWNVLHKNYETGCDWYGQEASGIVSQYDFIAKFSEFSVTALGQYEY